jgi:hypothetical protein
MLAATVHEEQVGKLMSRGEASIHSLSIAAPTIREGR